MPSFTGNIHERSTLGSEVYTPTPYADSIEEALSLVDDQDAIYVPLTLLFESDCIVTNVPDGVLQKPAVTFVRVDPASLPREVELHYSDLSQDYAIVPQTAKQLYGRIKNGLVETYAAASATQKMSITSSFGITADEAVTLAYDLLYRAWTQTVTMEFEHPDLSLEGGDVFVISGGFGSIIARIDEQTWTKNRTNQIKATALAAPGPPLTADAGFSSYQAKSMSGQPGIGFTLLHAPPSTKPNVQVNVKDKKKPAGSNTATQPSPPLPSKICPTGFKFGPLPAAYPGSGGGASPITDANPGICIKPVLFNITFDPVHDDPWGVPPIWALGGPGVAQTLSASPPSPVYPSGHLPFVFPVENGLGVTTQNVAAAIAGWIHAGGALTPPMATSLSTYMAGGGSVAGWVDANIDTLAPGLFDGDFANLKIAGTDGNTVLAGVPVIDTINVYDTGLTGESPPVHVADPPTGTLLASFAISGYDPPGAGLMAVSATPVVSSDVAITGTPSYFRGSSSGTDQMQGSVGRSGTTDSIGQPFDLQVDGQRFVQGTTINLNAMAFVSYNNDARTV